MSQNQAPLLIAVAAIAVLGAGGLGLYLIHQNNTAQAAEARRDAQLLAQQDQIIRAQTAAQAQPSERVVYVQQPPRVVPVPVPVAPPRPFWGAYPRGGHAYPARRPRRF